MVLFGRVLRQARSCSASSPLTQDCSIPFTYTHRPYVRVEGCPVPTQHAGTCEQLTDRENPTRRARLSGSNALTGAHARAPLRGGTGRDGARVWRDFDARRECITCCPHPSAGSKTQSLRCEKASLEHRRRLDNPLAALHRLNYYARRF